MDRFEAILLVVVGITISVVLGLLGEEAEERIRTWWKQRQVEKWERKNRK
tara:strand:+ start:41 stop:190 length:150 start_codon:yes stop_codon:yes gene_type:complete